MADSRKAASDVTARTGGPFPPVAPELLRAVVDIGASGGPTAVAFSAGADSAMLAYAVHTWASQQGSALLLFHVHHGLLPQADAWADHARRFARLIGRPLHVLSVTVDLGEGRGMEGAARDARYTALRQACADHGVDTLWLAHHRDDQAETVLLRLLRGAGVDGMAAMRASSDTHGIRLLRPWLDVAREDIRRAADDFARVTGWQAVDDPTNIDPKYTRAAVRHHLTPALNARWPGWQRIVARHARQADEAAQILADVARQDAEALHVMTPTGPAGLSLAAWRALSAPRQRNVLRHWLARQGARMPSEARLADMQRQLIQLHGKGHDRNMRVDHDMCSVRCVRGVIVVVPRGADE